MNKDAKRKQFTIAIIILALFAAALFVPQMREILIKTGESLIGRGLNHKIWNSRFVQLGTVLFLLDAAAFLILNFARLTVLAEPKISPRVFLYEKASSLSFDERLHLATLFVFAIVFLRFSVFVSPTTGDPHSYATALDDRSFLEFMKSRHYYWSSRLLIEALMVYIYRWNGLPWHILNMAAFITIAECTIQIALPKSKRRYSFLAYALLFLIPQHSLSDAGWGPTTTNYLWPLAAALPAFVTVKKQFCGEHLSKKKIAVSIVLATYAANQEQLAALMLGLFLVLLVYRIARNKKIEPSDFYLVALIIICAMSITYMFLCPGNFKRKATEISHWIPPYSTYSFMDKVQMGLLTILTYYFTERCLNFIIIPILVLLTIICYRKDKRLFIAQSALNLFVFYATYIAFYIKISGGKPLFSNVILARFLEYSEFTVFMETFFLVAALASLVLLTFAASKTRLGGLLNALILCAGFCSAFILAFSPTVYSSGTRCYLFMTEAIFIVTIRFFAQEEELHFLG